MDVAETNTKDRGRSNHLKQGRDPGDQSRRHRKSDRWRLNSPTFSFSPENKGPKSGDDLKPVSVSSHKPDGSGEDHPLGVHLLEKNTQLWHH